MPPKSKKNAATSKQAIKKVPPTAKGETVSTSKSKMAARRAPTQKADSMETSALSRRKQSKPASSTAKPKEISATLPKPFTTKRKRPAESATAAKPAKKVKLDFELNVPPSQKLDVYVFGSGENGELGLGYTIRNGKRPMDVRRPRLNDLLGADDTGVVQVAVGGLHCAALSHDNKIYTWGVNDDGALGRDTKVAKTAQDDTSSDSDDDDDDDLGLNPLESTPTAIPSHFFAEGTKFAQVVASSSTTFALTTTGLVYGWGTFRGGDGVIGFSKEGTLVAQKTKTQDIQRVPILIQKLKHIKFVAAGPNHLQALDHSGNVFSWGCGEQNQLGRRINPRTRANALVPTEFGLPKRKIKDISCGAFHSFAVDEAGRVFAWGLNNFGQTGISVGAGEANAIIGTPTVVSSLAPYKLTEIRGGTHHSIAVTEDQKILVWGRCDDSQAGIPLDEIPNTDLVFNDQNKPRILAVPTVVPDVSAVSVSAAIDNCLAITSKGEAYSWGFSANYRTGLGTQEPVEEPTKLENKALVGKVLTFAGCGGQFSVLAGPSSLTNGI